ncbi:MAG: ABC transporter ATP-binding protein [Clostridia bacterium]|nr:ABC transporter ATP-binding protein [Clostridia bacterium]MBQ7788629.1 ABC transporter ATP-binding protein [Clostridia bacterium]
MPSAPEAEKAFETTDATTAQDEVKEQIPEPETIIEVKNVSMDFYSRDEKVDNLKEFFIRLIRGKLEKKKTRILNNISFSVKKGESIALIGHNGAGKSTLLKMLTGIYSPTEGTIKVKGKVAPLLNLGAGFDHEASAKENVYLNGAILGYSRKELAKKYDEIVDFAELHDHMHIPIKNFSSGMVARLGFAIAIDVDPDILLVDEILSVGDENFRRKCANKIDELRKKGVTFVIVSHNIGQVKSLCQKAVWIENSELMAYGEVNEVCEKYQKYCESLKH